VILNTGLLIGGLLGGPPRAHGVRAAHAALRLLDAAAALVRSALGRGGVLRLPLPGGASGAGGRDAEDAGVRGEGGPGERRGRRKAIAQGLLPQAGPPDGSAGGGISFASCTRAQAVYLFPNQSS
jgi:hypothetical protein